MNYLAIAQYMAFAVFLTIASIHWIDLVSCPWPDPSLAVRADGCGGGRECDCPSEYVSREFHRDPTEAHRLTQHA